jgi:magnesium-transporting ATPase (P-type)
MVLVVGNYLLMTYMIPVTLKVILPVFRWCYGVFIENDMHFTDAETDVKPIAYTTNITENIGTIDIIVADKTGTLTVPAPAASLLSIGATVYGTPFIQDSIFEDRRLQKRIRELHKPGNHDEELLFGLCCLAVAHTAIIEPSGIRSESFEDVTILKMLGRLDIKVSQDWLTLAVQFPGWEANDPITYHFELLKSFPFTHERRKMSIIARWVERDEIFCWTKGASELIDRISGAEDIFDSSNFTRYGFRTLSFAFQVFSGQEEPTHGFTYAGSIAFSDGLQQDAAVSLDMLKKAKIKIWVATGDQILNTLVICKKLRIVDTNLPILHFRGQDDRYGLYPENFAKCVATCDEGYHFSVFVSAFQARALDEFLEDPDNINALMRADSVVFYQCTPYSKGKIVSELRNAGRRVMGVGDGSNDSELLRMADVGVGLISQEETAVFAKCDFALPSFRSICRLILVHGHLSLHRSLITVHFSFYKGVLFALVQAIYQYWTEFTGQSPFDSLAIGTYNMLWTFFPMLSIIFERDIADNFLLRLSNLYPQLRADLNVGHNIGWLIAAIYQSISTMIVLKVITGDAYESVWDGKGLGVRFLSMDLFIAIVAMTTTFLVSQLNMLTYYSIVCLIGTIIGMIATFAFFQTPLVIKLSEWIGYYAECFDSVYTITVIMALVFTAVVPTHVVMVLWNERYHSLVRRVVEVETTAARTDQPVFYDPPKDEKHEARYSAPAEPQGKLRKPSPRYLSRS